MADITKRVLRKNKGVVSERPLTISAQYGLIDQRDFFNKVVASENLEGYYLLKRGEFAYNKSYSNEHPWGAVKRLDTYDEGVLSTLYICFECFGAHSDWLVHYFDSPKWNGQVSAIAVEGARNHGLLNVAIEDFFGTQHFIPNNRAEQEKIASFLNLIDERITAQIRIIDKLGSLIRGLEQQLLKPKGNWRICTIGDVLAIGSGKDYKHLSSGDIPVYGTGGYMLSVSDFLYDGDSVCIGRKGTIDKPLFMKGKFWTVDTLFYTYDFRGILPRYCYFLFQTINWQMYNEASGVPSLSKDTIERIKITIPDIEEQKKTCLILDSIAEKLSLEQSYLGQLVKEKKYLLRTLFV